MARKILFAEGGGLASLQTSDKEGLGVLYEDEYGRLYRYVKNAGSTALAAAGCCLRKLGQTTAKGVVQRVLSPDAATGPATCLMTMPAGVPVTAIAASGASTGDHGWIQVRGPARVSMMQSATAVDQEAGCISIGTMLSTGLWDKPVSSMVDTDGTPQVNFAHVRLAAALATTGVATAASAVVMVNCLE